MSDAEHSAPREPMEMLQNLAPPGATKRLSDRERDACLKLIEYLRNATSITKFSPDLIQGLTQSLAEGRHPRVLELRINHALIGWLFDVKDVWVLQYNPVWVRSKGSFALAPGLALGEDACVDGSSNRPVQWYFDNLLPEEELRKSLAKEGGLAFEDVFGLLRHYGSESAGSLVLQPLGQAPAEKGLRQLQPEELSQRIQNLPRAPLTKSSPKRMSLAGSQHKMVVVAQATKEGVLGDLYEPLPGTASTHILKPNAIAASYPHSVANEYFTMRLATAMKLDVPQVFRRFVPEPVYIIDRFDRKNLSRPSAQGAVVPEVGRRHVIDTCQLLNQSRALKYEAANLQTLKDALACTRSRALSRHKLYQWLVFNVLVGNGDNHLKNVSFTVDPTGIELAPGYDLLCTAVYDTVAFADQAAIWPLTGLGTVLAGATKFNEVTYDNLLQAGLELGVGANAARRILTEMLTRISGEAQKVAEEIQAEYKALAERLGPGHPQCPSAAGQGGEVRLLRAITHIVIRDMVAQVSAGMPKTK